MVLLDQFLCVCVCVCVRVYLCEEKKSSLSLTCKVIQSNKYYGWSTIYWKIHEGKLES